MFNRSQEAARRRRQMEPKEKINAGMDAVRGHNGGGAAARVSGDNRGGDVVPSPWPGGTLFYCLYHPELAGQPARKHPHFRTAARYRRHYRLYH